MQEASTPSSNPAFLGPEAEPVPYEDTELPDLFGFDINAALEPPLYGGNEQQQQQQPQQQQVQIQIQEQQPMEMGPMDQVWIAIKTLSTHLLRLPLEIKGVPSGLEPWLG